MRKANILTAAFLLIGLLIGSTVSAQRIDLGRASSAQQCANIHGKQKMFWLFCLGVSESHV